jgi:hypothetical protein
MSTRVFISWSGDFSCKLAEAIRNWLPKVLQFVKPYFSPEDVEKGTKWDSDITKELEASNIGLLCLTPDNIEKPWLLFEAGALSKYVDKSRVCTILFDLNPTDLKGPLTLFQGTKINKEDFKKLISTINNAAGESKLESQTLDAVFEKWWPELEAKIKEVQNSRKDEPKKESRGDRDILDEILELVRILAIPKPQNIYGFNESTFRGALETAISGVPEQTSGFAAALRDYAAHYNAATTNALREIVKTCGQFEEPKDKPLKPEEKR